MAGGSPTVEIVMRRALIPQTVVAAGHLQRRQQPIEIRQRLAHSHDDDVA